MAQSFSSSVPPARATTAPLPSLVLPSPLPGKVVGTGSSSRLLAVSPTVTSVSPMPNKASAPRASNVTFTLSQALNAGSANAVRVFGSRRGGLLAGAGSVSGSTVTFNPTLDFQPGETVQATLTTAAQSTSGIPVDRGYVTSFVAAVSNGAGTYTAAPNLTIPGNGQGVAIGDVNGDGIMDVVIGTGNSTLLTYIGTGGGSFAAPVSTATGSGPSQVVLADVDNDGDLDAVTPSFGAGGTSVHRNVGGVLGAATLLPTGPSPRNVAVVDVDGDGDLDILTNSVGNSNVTLNLNNAGTFAAATQVATTGASPYGIAAADFNGDGIMDFATADANGNTLSIRLGVGNGTFTAAANVNPGLTPFGLVAGDLNGDNIADLVTCNRNGTTVVVALGVGNGTFGTPTTVTVGSQPIDVSLADVDADGDLDLLVANFNGANVSVCRNSGAGTFAAAATYAANTQPFVIMPGDVNGDGALDLVTANLASTATTVLYNGTSLTDLTVSTTANIPGGAYNNITVTGTGVGTVTGSVSVAGAFVVQPGGVLNTNCQAISGSGTFTLQAGAELQICDPAGISSTGATGAVQVIGARTFSFSGRYTYNGTAAQVTGNALPSRVRDLAVSNGTGVTLSAATSVAQVLRLTSGVLNTNGQPLTLLSTDSTGTALAVNTNGSVTGNVTVQRYINPSLNAGPGYRHYAAPVTNTTVADLATGGPNPFSPTLNAAYNTSATPNLITPFPTVFGYDESRVLTSPATTYSGFDKGWFSPAAATDPLTPGLGYTVNIAGSEKVDFVGTLGNGPVSRTLNRAGGSEGGLHLVGNPYPAPLDWSKVTIPAGLDNAMYVYQSTAQYAGGYRSYVGGIGDPLVSSGQGFFVRVTPGSSSATLTFTNTARVTTYATQPAFNRSAETRPLVQLRLQGQGSPLTDDAYVYQQADATAGIDAAYDAVKLSNPHGLNVASVAAGQEVAINGLPVLTAATVVPLRLTVPQAGTYSLSAQQLLNTAPGTVFLHDDVTGRDVNLSQQAVYSFELSSLTAANRFSLRFEPSRPLAAQASPLAAATGVYPNPAHGSFLVQLPKVAQGGTAELVLLNALGQQVHQQAAALSAVGSSATVRVPALAAGVYVLQVRLGTEVISKRIVLN
ncbi:FG-GAP-like repeat-containing protein [Hymenobacter aquaticus]|uniref:FG-GAP-like repeat-containing protein n=1 Tax=Hymenobacter aquaticus TaxID=1867101 RepID=UPI001436C715|nr:FG-GAP-like repeat-containing protein [Hymenobacter aquaticus]